MNATMPITRDELKAWRDSNREFTIVDVLTPEAYAGAHLPGAKNACVYEVTFLDQIQKLPCKKETTLVLYGSGPRNRASATAAEKLLHAGYLDIHDYHGGLEDWMGAELPVEGSGKVTENEESPLDGCYQIDTQSSQIEWTGRNLTGSHTGTLKLRNGTITVESGFAKSGVFTIDIASIQNRDLADSTLRQMLLTHLLSDDFFDVQRFPTAEFNLSHIEKLKDATPGSPNCKVAGGLTLKGVTHPLAFEAVISQTAERALAAEAHFDIDRTQWNVLYGSGKFYEKLGKHLVHDHVSIGLKILTLPR